MDFVMKLTDRLVVMEFGTKISEGLPADVQKRSGGVGGVPGRSGVMATDWILQVESLSVRYGKVEALHDGKLSVGAGQIVSVIGPNGAGKSTLYLTPSWERCHHLATKRHCPISRAIEKRVSRGMCLVPEKCERFSTMRVEDNLVPGAYRRKRAGEKNYLDQLDHVFALFPRLKERRKQVAGTLSGGERQMLVVGRALMASHSC